MTLVKRAFADLPSGQIHYRYVREENVGNIPLLMLHGSPGSSRQLEKFMQDLASVRWVIAPDTPGNGDSIAIAGEETTIALLAEAMLAFLDVMEIEVVDLYGTHTGACIATELAILAGDRVRSVILDGVAAFSAEEQADMLSHYAYPFEPDNTGAYLVNMYHFCRNQHLFFPWYKQTREARRDSGVASAQDLHIWLLEVMKGSQTYHHNYRAAFQWDGMARAALCSRPTLCVCSESDPLYGHTQILSDVFPDGRFTALPRFDHADFTYARYVNCLSFWNL